MDKTRVPLDRIDWILLMAILGLSGFLVVELAEPAAAAWRNRARPGVQVCRRCVVGESDAAAITSVQSERHQAVTATTIGYLLYLPRDYATQGPWPLVVFLHGAGECGDDLEVVRRVGLPRQIEQGAASRVADAVLNGFVLVSPQCPKHSGWSAAMVLGLIERVGGEFSVDRDRVYLTGYSMGGFATWEIACHDPDRFAAIAPLCGGGPIERAGRLKDVPVWAFHGGNDKVVPPEASRAMVDAVVQCGGRAQLTVYPGEGHGILDVTCENPRLYEWLLAQRRGRARAASQSGGPAR